MHQQTESARLLSVIIPVYNGARFIKKTVKNILRQDYPKFEVVLVENGSSDDSFAVCKALAETDHRVRVFHNEEKGTSLARRRGIAEAQGDYIIFSDQDDRYAALTSFSKMVAAIEEDGSQICQFGHYVSYIDPFLVKKVPGKRLCLSRNELMADEIIGVIGGWGKTFNVNVWTKIYKAEVLKHCAANIAVSLRFAEDELLNLYAFFDENTVKVSAREEAYYVWDSGTGFSGNEKNAEVLFSEYQYIKPLTVKLIQENSCPDAVMWQCHTETVYFLKALAMSYIRSENSTEKRVCAIKKWGGVCVRPGRKALLSEPAAGKTVA